MKKPSNEEEEYFAKQESARLKAQAIEKARELQAEELEACLGEAAGAQDVFDCENKDRLFAKSLGEAQKEFKKGTEEGKNLLDLTQTVLLQPVVETQLKQFREWITFAVLRHVLWRAIEFHTHATCMVVQ